jgi:hypothetical protein
MSSLTTRSSATSRWWGCTATSNEARGAQKIGSTLCLNPGSDYTADLLRGVVVDIAQDGTYLDFLLTAG